MNITDPFAFHAEVLDQSRRLQALEATILGIKAGLPPLPHLVSLYWDACRLAVLDETSARHWERQLFQLDARTLLHLSRATRDPTPWHPFVIVLDRFIEEGYDLETCRQHMLRAAQDLLDLQGLRKIMPRDVMGNPLRIKTVLAAISRRGGLHGHQALRPDREAGTRRDP